MMLSGRWAGGAGGPAGAGAGGADWNGTTEGAGVGGAPPGN